MRAGTLAVMILGCAGAWPCHGRAAEEVESPLVALSLSEALRDGTPILVVRPRFTWVDQANQPEDTQWASVRTQLGWKTLEYRGFQLTAEVIDVARFDSQNIIEYTSSPGFTNGSPVYGAPGGPTIYAPFGPGYYPRVADPNQFDINRLYLDYTGLPQTRVRAGRQVVRLDNQRFIGDYDFGQMPQLLDGVNLSTDALPRTSINYGYFWRVRNAYAVEWASSINAASVSFDVVPVKLKVAAYGVFQNQARTGSVTGFADNSNSIIGARAQGVYGLPREIDLEYLADVAQQRSFAGGDSRIRANYYRVAGGVSIKQGFARLSWEKLSSNSGQYGFQTPLGSTQMFTGRVDMFQTTPLAGLEDLRASVGASFWKLTARLDYHKFQTDFSDRDLGHEWDFALDFNITSRISASVVYGDYQAGAPQTNFPDTQKLWLTVAFVY
jgi:hypothetical protein